MREPKPVREQWLTDLDVNNMYLGGNHVIWGWGSAGSGKSNWHTYFLKSRGGLWAVEKEHKSPFKS